MLFKKLFGVRGETLQNIFEIFLRDALVIRPRLAAAHDRETAEPALFQLFEQIKGGIRKHGENQDFLILLIPSAAPFFDDLRHQRV